MKIKRWVLIGSLVAADVGSAAAQTPALAHLSDSLRHSKPEFAGARVTPVLRVTSDSVRPGRAAGMEGGIPRTRWQGAVRGAKVGAVTGAALTMVVSALALGSDRGGSSSAIPVAPFAIGFALVSTAGTTLAGAGLGAAAPGWRRAR